MFCIKCGGKNPEGSKFCSKCGALLIEEGSEQTVNSSEVHTPNVQTFDDLPEMEISNSKGIHCPKCKSDKVQALVESDVQGGYKAGRGCLGWLLFGPLGLLCGALGKSAKVSVTNNTSFICQECGHKFPQLDEMIAIKQKEARLHFIGGSIVAILGVFCLFGELLGAIVFILAGMGWILMGKEKMKECESLRKDGYDSPCFMEKKK